MKAQLNRTVCAVAAIGLIGLGGCATTGTKAEAPAPKAEVPQVLKEKRTLLGAPTYANYGKLAKIDIQWSFPRDHEAIKDVDGKFYYVSTQSDEVSAIDGRSGKILKTMKTDKASLKKHGFDVDKFKSIALPHHAYVVPGGKYLYVGNESREHDVVWVIDTETDTIVKSFRAGMGKVKTAGPLHLSFSPTEPIALFGMAQDNKQGAISVIDAVKHEAIDVIITKGGAQVRDIIVTLDGKWAYAAHQYWAPDKPNGKGHVDLIDMKTRKVAKTFTEIEGNPFLTMTSDGKYIIASSDKKAVVSIIDNGSKKVVKQIKIKPGTAQVGNDGKPKKVSLRNLAVHPNNKKAYVGIPPYGELAIVDLVKLEQIGTVKAGKMANSAYFTKEPFAKYAIICNEGDDYVNILDGDTDKVVKNVNTGNGSHNIAWNAKGDLAIVSSIKDNRAAIINMHTLDYKEISLGFGAKGVRWAPYMPGLSGAKPYREGASLANTAKK